MPFYVLSYNGTKDRFEGVDDEDGLYIGLSRVPPPKLEVVPRPDRATKILTHDFPQIEETPVSVAREDGTPIFTGVRRHPMTRLHQFEGVDGSLRPFFWNP